MNYKKGKAKARRNRYFSCNFGNSSLVFTAWKKREAATAKEALKDY